MHVLALSLLLPQALATEGMWLPEQVPAIAAPMQAAGLELDPAVLADPLGEPMGAIVTLGFCSASFVSADGLVATNHHCVEGFLQYLSSGEMNHHRDGFVAPTQADEASAGPTARMRVVESITDVTGAVMVGIGKRTKDADRDKKIEANRKALIATCEAEPDRRCSVVPYFGGSTWRLIKTFEIEDVRMVYAPPMALGQFGGDIDNWMWPRHGADFAFARAYVAPDGSAAPFSEDNVPYQPPHHLEVNLDGVDAGDFVMVAGFPGRTARHRLAMELEYQGEVSLPLGVAWSEQVVEVLQGHADADPEAAARVGVSISRVANGLKNAKGTLDGFAGNDVVGRKRAEEAEMLAWIDADKKRARRLRPVYEELQQRIATEQADAGHMRALGRLFQTADLLGTAHTALRNAHEAAKPDAARKPGYQARDQERLLASFQRLERSLWLPADRDLTEMALTAYVATEPALHVASLDGWLDSVGGVDGALKVLFTDPALAKADARLALLTQDEATLRSSEDPWLRLAVAMEDFLGPRREAREAVDGAFSRLRAAWLGAKRQRADATGTPLYDDANSSLRITYGNVQGYEPMDGLVAMPFTTLRGLAAKAGEAPFDAPADVLARIPEAPNSRWAVPELGQVPMDFLSDLDITGGNSGSAVLDGKGRLVGLAFDGNYESIASDWLYLPPVTRCISVDVRYMLWLMEGEPGAARLLAELGAE